MSLKEFRINNSLTYEDIATICGLDIETVIDCETNQRSKNYWALNIIQSVLELDYEDVVYTQTKNKKGVKI